MDYDRIKHSYVVAKKMMEIAVNYDLSKEDINNCFLIGLNHDIGYEFTTNGINHNKIGGQLLRDNGFKYWKEVYYHGDVDCTYDSIFLEILNKADMQIDKYGNDVGYTKRLEDIKNRYGEDSIVYKNCIKLIESINKKN
ncbi:MAG TPA: HD domain-containing protein [Mollicutes bacterium]|nr:HD domain-containing protein [Mollicutes bacterium]